MNNFVQGQDARRRKSGVYRAYMSIFNDKQRSHGAEESFMDGHVLSLPLNFRQGGELDSTGVWKLKSRVGGLQPRKNAEQNTNADSNYEYALAA